MHSRCNLPRLRTPQTSRPDGPEKIHEQVGGNPSSGDNLRKRWAMPAQRPRHADLHGPRPGYGLFRAAQAAADRSRGREPWEEARPLSPLRGRRDSCGPWTHDLRRGPVSCLAQMEVCDSGAAGGFACPCFSTAGTSRPWPPARRPGRRARKIKTSEVAKASEVWAFPFCRAGLQPGSARRRQVGDLPHGVARWRATARAARARAALPLLPG